MDLEKLKTFIVFVQTGNAKLTAEQLNLSVPAIYNHLRCIQEETGIVLFKHHGRKTVLTDAGKTFYHRIQPSLFNIEKTVSNLQTFQTFSNTVPIINIGTSLMFPISLIKETIYDFSNMHNDIKLCVMPISNNIRNSKEMLQVMKSENIHCICMFSNQVPDNDDFLFYHIGKTELCLAIPPGNSLYGRKAVSLHELNDQCVVLPLSYDPISQKQIINSLKSQCHDIEVIQLDQYVTPEVINSCIMSNQIILAYDILENSFPIMRFTKLEEQILFSYGLLFLTSFDD